MENSLTTRQQRSSNIELLRILAMVGIVFTHLAGNSHITLMDDSFNRFVYELFKYGGGTGNNLFILISGYFMVYSRFKSSKVIRLTLEITFYSISLYLLSCCVGAADFSVKHFIQSMVPLISGRGGYWFAVTYIILYLLSAVLNKGILNASKKQLQLTIIVLLFIFSFMPSVVHQFISINDFWYSQLAWMITIYILGAYLRLYPIVKLKSNTFNFILFISFLILIIPCRIIHTSSYNAVLDPIISVIIKIFSSLEMYNFPDLISAILLFSIFCNINVKYDKYINSFGSATFGVYLIHNNIWFKEYMWVNIFKVCNFQYKTYFVLYCFFVVLIIMLVGTIIDIIRREYLEKSIMSFSFLSVICNVFDSKLKD